MKPGGQIGVMAVITLLLAACSGEPGADATTSSPDAAALTTSTVDTSAPDFVEAAGGFRHPAGPACDGLVDEYLDELQQQLSSYESVELADLAREIPDEAEVAAAETTLQGISSRARDEGCGSGMFFAVLASRGNELQAETPATIAVKANWLSYTIFFALDADDGNEAGDYLEAQLDPDAPVAEAPFLDAASPQACDEIADRAIGLASWVVPNSSAAWGRYLRALDEDPASAVDGSEEIEDYFDRAIELLGTEAEALGCGDLFVETILLTRGNEITATGGFEIISSSSLIAAAWDTLSDRLAEPHLDVLVDRDHEIEAAEGSIGLKITATNVAGVPLTDVTIEIDGVTVLEADELLPDESTATAVAIPTDDPYNYMNLPVTTSVTLPGGEVVVVTNPAWR